jgi:hypothetical protein
MPKDHLLYLALQAEGLAQLTFTPTYPGKLDVIIGAVVSVRLPGTNGTLQAEGLAQLTFTPTYLGKWDVITVVAARLPGTNDTLPVRAKHNNYFTQIPDQCTESQQLQ